MVRYALRSLVAHGRRATLTALAVVLGVSMITGTLIFTDTIDSAFTDLFRNSNQGATVIVSSRQEIASVTSTPASLPASLVGQIRRLRGVGAAAGEISDTATIVGDNGQVLRTTGLPTLALSYLPRPFTGLRFVAGQPPRGAGAVAIDSSTASREGFLVGDTVKILTAQPARSFQVSGIVKLAPGTLGGATVAVFDLGTAQQLYSKQRRVDRIYVAAAHGVAARFLLREIRPLLPAQFVVRTNTDQTSASTHLVTDQLGLVTGGLLAFGWIAVLVGAFVIFNTFSITVAQRVREFSVLRALGALRRQLLVSVLAEAAAIGLLGAVVGLGCGVLAALLIHALFNALGTDLPSSGIVLRGRTVLVGVGTGVVVTLVAGLLPALRATRAAPLESLREESAPAPRRYGPALRALLATLLGCAGVIVIATASGTVAARLEAGVIGSAAVLLAVLLLSPLLVAALARLLTWPVARTGGVVAKLAQENARRNPARTAVSASSLIIGLTLVLFVMIYASGLRNSSHSIIGRTFAGDLTIQSQDGQSPIPPGATQAVNGLPNLLAISSLKTAPGRLGTAGNVSVQGVDPTTIGQLYRFNWVSGSAATLASLGPGRALVEQDTARAAHLEVGSATTLISDTGVAIPLRVAGIYADRAMLVGVTLSRAQFDQSFDQPRLQDIFIKLAPGSNVGDAQATLAQGLSSFPGVVVRSERQLADQVASRVNAILILFYALLALSVVMSLLGIVNTLNLSVYERTRELGMLRAMGMTARQAQILIRDESLITAAIGSIVGVALGVFLAWAVIDSVSAEGVVFSPPWLAVLAVFAVGLGTGVIAALTPARRASKLDVLAAIAHE
ncbi:MAG: ABC transporter permease [Solirubrobacteraceae bacterium]